MKFRRSAIILIAAVMLLAAAFIYFDARLLEKIEQTSQIQDDPQPGGQNGMNGSKDTSGNSDPDGSSSENANGETIDEASAEELVASENVTVGYNSPEYDIEVTLCENTEKRTFLRLKYYVDGISTVNDLYEEQIPELAGVFENRERESGKKQDEPERTGSPYTIGQALLNPVFGQLYLLINGAPLDTYTQSSLYVINLYDISVKKLFSYPARYGKMSFSSDFTLLAYDFEDPPVMSMYQEDSLFEVYSCTGEEYLVRGSRRQDQSLIGPDSDPGYIYDYTFKGWVASDTVKLTRTLRPIGDTGAAPSQKEVIYNVISNNMYNTDGSEIGKVNGGQGNADDPEEGTQAGTDGKGADSGNRGGEAGQVTDGGAPAVEEREPVKQLKSFYSYLGSENDYKKAMQLLDDGFILRLGILRQFGINEIRKSDIDAGYNQDNVAMYSELLKAAKFERLADAEISDSTAVIKYYQTLGIGADSQVSQLMSARLEKKDKVWIIKLIEDGIK